MYIKAALSVPARSLMVALYGHATVSWKPQFDLGAHLGDVKSMIHNRTQQKLAEEREGFS